MKEFLGYMQTVKGKSPKTVEEYYMDLRTFFRYMKIKWKLVNQDTPMEEINILDIDINQIKTVKLLDVFEYMNYLISERENIASTRSRKVSSLRSFFKFLTNKTQQLDVNPIEELETPKKKKSLPKFLTLEQSKMLLNIVNQYGRNNRERDYCIITLFLNCGMRLSELVGMNINDIRQDGTLKITGKGDKERIIYINDACKAAVNRYLDVRHNYRAKDKNAMFISRNNNRISPKTVQFLLNKYLTLSGLQGQGFSVHKLRHTAATLMYQYGEVDIRILKDILGHENLGTTEIYTHLSDKQMQDAVKSNPLSSIKID
ncbi:MAG: tyrosine recombinase XerC [Oscillospiraceae bacterium]|jgi:site-specific recombinase XerD|nr:tyrosine recombinase XerC [Oscillospiraceae bacterium]